MKLILAAVLLLGIAGCATTNQAPEQVLIPVAAQCPAPQLPERPYLPVAALTDSSNPADVMRAYAVSVSECTAYAEQLETLLHTYEKQGAAK